MDRWKLVIFCGLFLNIFELTSGASNCKNSDTFGNEKWGDVKFKNAAQEDDVDDTVIVLDTGDTSVDSQNKYKIDCCAIIEEWEYDARTKDEFMEMLVFRPVGADYLLIWSQEFEIEEIDKKQKLAHDGEQVNLLPGDIIGWTGNYLNYEDSNNAGDTDFALEIFKANGLTIATGTTYNNINTDVTVGPTVERRNYAIKLKVDFHQTLTCTVTIDLTTINSTDSNIVIGSVVMDDPYYNVNSQITHSVSTPNNAYFAVNTSGSIYTTAEIPVDLSGGATTQVYTLTLDLLDVCGNTVSCSGSVTVKHANKPINITSLPDIFNITEQTTAATNVHTIVTTDDDRLLTTDNPTCTVASTIPVGAPFSAVVDGGDPLVWYVQSNVNPGFEDSTVSQYDITVECTDTEGSSDSKVLRVYILPNEPPVPTNATASVTMDAFTTTTNDVAYTATYTDPESDTVVFTLIKETASSPFAINSATGAVYATMALATVSQRIHNFAIQYYDGWNYVNSTLVITIEGTNTEPAFVNCAAPGMSVSIPENMKGEKTITHAGVIDANLHLNSQTLNCTFVSISVSFSSYFDVSSDNTGCYIVLKSSPDPTTALNFEANGGGPIILEVAVNDGIDYAATNCFVNIDVTNVNEAPVFAYSVQTIYIEEELTTPMVVTEFNATVIDEDAGDTKTYTIASGNDDNFFLIDPATGEITLDVYCDLEYNCSLVNDLVIHCTDSTGLVASCDVKIVINDTNDNTPSCTPDSVIYVTSNNSLNQLLATVTCTDRDSTPENSNISIDIVGVGIGRDYFLYSNGNIELNKKWDLPIDFQYKFSVCAIDTGSPTKSGCAVITVNPQTTTVTTPKVYRTLGFFETEGGVAIFTIIMGCIFGLLLCGAGVCLRRSACERWRWPCKSRPKKRKVRRPKPKQEFKPRANVEQPKPAAEAPIQPEPPVFHPPPPEKKLFSFWDTDIKKFDG